MSATVGTGKRSSLKPPAAKIGQVELLASRAQLYERLSYLYGSPDGSFLDPALPASLRWILEGCSLSSFPHISVLEEHLGGLQDVLSMSLEYVRLFRGPAKAMVYPYESMHVDGEIMGPSTMAVASSYRAAGLSPAQEFKDLADHISVELEFMYYLCSMELRARSAGNDAEQARFQNLQSSFLAEHLVKWVPGFTDAILSNTSSPFYQVLATLTREFLSRESTRAAVQ